MVQFATAAELATFKGITIAAGADTDRANLLLQLASAEVQKAARQTLAVVAGDVLRLAGNWTDELVLPQRPVTAVASVKVDGTTLGGSTYEWTRLGVLRRLDRTWGGPGVEVEVTYTHGYATIPDDARGVTLQAASRGWDNPSALQSEGVGDYSTVYGINPVGGVLLTSAERDSLAHYRRPTGSAAMVAR